jgi:hypothetical protein
MRTASRRNSSVYLVAILYLLHSKHCSKETGTKPRQDQIARRANALLLLEDGKSCQVIAEFLYLDDDIVRGWHKTYRENGWDAVAAV